MLKWLKCKEAPTSDTVTFKFEGEVVSPHPDRKLRGDESPQDRHAEFERDFCHRPGENFISLLRKDNAWRLEAWLKEDAEAKAFVTLAVDSIRQGVTFWEQSCIVGFRHGGPPPRETSDALSVLAQYVGVSIKLYFKDSKGETRVLDFSKD